MAVLQRVKTLTFLLRARHLKPEPTGKRFYSCDEVEVIDIGEEGERIAVGLAAVAMIMRKIARLVDMERWCFLIMEGAAPRPGATSLLEIHSIADDAN